jgi:hypothetical protein
MDNKPRTVAIVIDADRSIGPSIVFGPDFPDPDGKKRAFDVYRRYPGTKHLYAIHSTGLIVAAKEMLGAARCLEGLNDIMESIDNNDNGLACELLSGFSNVIRGIESSAWGRMREMTSGKPDSIEFLFANDVHKACHGMAAGTWGESPVRFSDAEFARIDNGWSFCIEPGNGTRYTGFIVFEKRGFTIEVNGRSNRWDVAAGHIFREEPNDYHSASHAVYVLGKLGLDGTGDAGFYRAISKFIHDTED